MASFLEDINSVRMKIFRENRISRQTDTPLVRTRRELEGRKVLERRYKIQNVDDTRYQIEERRTKTG